MKIRTFNSLFLKIVFILGLLFASSSLYSQEGELNQYLDDLASQMAAGITRNSGYVIYLRGNDVYLDLGFSSGGKLEQEWEVVREGSDILNPLSGNIVGKSEESIGKIVINKTREKLAIAAPVPPLTAEHIKIGDRIYLTSRPRKLAVMRLVGEGGESSPFFSIMSDIFTQALRKQPNIEIVPPEEIEAGLKKMEDINLSNYNGFLAQKPAMKIGRLLGVDGLILGNIFKGKDKYLINVRLIETKDGRTSRFFEKYIPETEGIKAFVSLRPASPAKREELIQRLVKIGEEDFDFPVLGQGLEDIDADGQPEVVLLTKEQLRLFNWDGLFFNEKLSLKIKSQTGIPLFSRKSLGNLVIADLNRNHLPEVYYSLGNMSGGEVVEWDGKSFLRSSLTYYHPLSAYQGERGGQLIMGLYLDTRNYFQAESTKEISFGSSSTQIIDRNLGLSDDFYQVVCGDIDQDGRNEWLVVDTADKINVYNSDFTLRWQSYPLFGIALSLIDIDSDGQPEVIASSRSLTGEEDRFFILRWDGISLSKVFVSQPLTGSIYHLCGGDIDGDKEPEIIICLSSFETTEANSRLQIYKVK